MQPETIIKKPGAEDLATKGRKHLEKMRADFDKHLLQPMAWMFGNETRYGFQPEFASLAERLLATARHHERIDGCVGLAAPQIGERVPMFAYRNPHPDSEAADPWAVVLYPQIHCVSCDNETMREGCMSLPGKSVEVTRPVSINVSYYYYRHDATSCWNRGFGRGQCETGLELHGMAARVWLHEYDHLIGAITIDNLDWRSKRQYLSSVGNTK